MNVAGNLIAVSDLGLYVSFTLPREKAMRESEKGFSLVELSIVFVIIGLLIGGILAAQSMINTAKIQALVKQEGQFDAAVENFQTKFQQLPGDTNLMGAIKGDNNGLIGNAGAGWGGEIAKFWSDLSNSGLTNPSGTPYTDGSGNGADIMINTSSQVPLAPLENNAYVFAASSIIGKNYYFIGQPTHGRYNYALDIQTTFTPAEAFAIDTKMDDGNPSAGNMLVTDSSNEVTVLLTSNTGILPTYGSGCSTSAGSNKYNTNVTTQTCTPIIRIGTSTGDLK